VRERDEGGDQRGWFGYRAHRGQSSTTPATRLDRPADRPVVLVRS
jgi:hypothetical protein